MSWNKNPEYVSILNVIYLVNKNKLIKTCVITVYSHHSKILQVKCLLSKNKTNKHDLWWVSLIYERNECACAYNENALGRIVFSVS